LTRFTRTEAVTKQGWHWEGVAASVTHWIIPKNAFTHFNGTREKYQQIKAVL
jgi:hypothetical protein